MYSAVSNLGAGGTQDVSLSDTSNAVLYAMFSLTGLVAGGINNRKEAHRKIVTTSHASFISVLGPRLTLFLGTLGYALYVGALWWQVALVSQKRRSRLTLSQFSNSRHSLVPYPRWGTTRNHGRAPVVSSGCNNDELSPRKRQGQSFRHFLGTVPIWRLHWLCHSPRHQHQRRKLRCSIDIDLYRESIVVAGDEHRSPCYRHS